MESMRWNLRMQRCDLASRGSASSAAKCVLSEPYEPVIPVFPLVAKDCYEIPITVKVEGDDEVDDISCQGSQEGDVHLLKADVGLFAKEEENFIVKTGNDMVEVTVKQELDIGPMVLQPKSTPCELPPPTLEDDFVKSTESETVEVMVKQELDIGPLVLQPKTIPCQFLSPTLPSLPDPCPSLLDHYPSFSWANDMAPATPYLVSRMPKTNAQRCKDYYGCNQAEKRKRAAERVRVHRLRRRMTSERSGTSACSPLSAVSNSDAGAATAGSSGRRASDASNGIGSNEVGDNTWTSPSPTPAQDCRGDAAARAAVRMRNSPRLCDRRATKKIPLTSAERTRRWRARKKLKCVGIR